jgi:hypothetical protein
MSGPTNGSEHRLPRTTATSEAGVWRAFLMREPKPALVRIHAGDETKDLEVADDVVWSRMGETVAALEPRLVECYDEEMALLRAQKSNMAARAPSGGVVIPGVLASDPNAALLGYFASLLAQAHSFSHVAFDVLRGLTESQTNDNATLRVENAKLREDLEELRTQLAETVVQLQTLQNTPPDGDDMASAFMKNVVMGKVGAVEGAPKNGASQ